MAETDPGSTRITPDPVAEIDSEARRRALVPRLYHAVRMDVTPLRTSREFRLLFIGQGISFAGGMVTYVALPYQAYLLSGSSLAVGLLSLTELIPILVMAFLGGALADAIDRRRMIRITESALCLVSAALVANALLAHAQLWALFIAAGLMGGLDAVQRPALDALVPRIVDRGQMPAAVALGSLRGNLGQVLGPALAGVLIATAGLPVTYLVDVASFGASLLALSMMRAVPPDPDAPGLSLAAVANGLRYARGRQDLLGTYLVDINAMFFGMPLALFPQLAASLGGAGALGLLYAAPSVGALLATLTSGWVRRVRRHGRAIALAAATWGVAIIGLGLAAHLWQALVALVLAGAADMTSGLFRMTVWNQTVPDALRGRLAGIEMISYTSGPALGNVEAGLVEALVGLRFSIISGGVLCVAGTAVVAALLPRFWRYLADEPR